MGYADACRHAFGEFDRRSGRPPQRFHRRRLVEHARSLRLDPHCAKATGGRRACECGGRLQEVASSLCIRHCRFAIVPATVRGYAAAAGQLRRAVTALEGQRLGPRVARRLACLLLFRQRSLLTRQWEGDFS
jgi:hypothetical protein